MAQLKPFKALRYTDKAGKIGEICCPPYDIISEEQRLDYIKKNEHNIIRLELPKESENPYKTASDILNKWLNDGILKKDDEPAFYIYGESFEVNGKNYSFKGIIGRVKLEEFEKGIVLPHENTLSKAKADRFELMKATNCNFSQIYSLYIDKEGTTPNLINSVTTDAPDKTFTDSDGVAHSLWICTDKTVCDEITNQFKDRKLYIADGHHRYETGINYRNYCHENKINEDDGCDNIMMMLVDMENPGLVVLPTHRVVFGIENFDFDRISKDATEYFDIEKVASYSLLKEKMDEGFENNIKVFGCYTSGEYYLFTLKAKISEIKELADMDTSLSNLDVTVLHSLILEKYLGIDKENMAKQINLSYTRDADEGIDSVNKGSNACFFLNSTRISEIADVASAGEKMPQKSTYFYPKLITGLVMNQLNNK